MHAGSVLLVSSLETGLASPRLSVVHNDFFETIRYNHCNMQTKSMWHILSLLDYADTIQRQQKVLASSTENVMTF